MDCLNNRWHYFLKGSIAFLMAAVLLLVSVPLLALAEETDGEEVYTYELRYQYESEKTIIEKKYFIESKFRLAFIHTGSRTVKYTNKEIVYDKYGLIANSSSSGILSVLCESYTLKSISTGEVTDLRPENGYETLGYTAFDSVNPDKLSSLGFEVTYLETDIPVLDSLEDVKTYFETGINPEDINDFDNDYDPSMPVPQLGNVTHKGFSVTGAPEGYYYLQLKVESTVYGMELRDCVGGLGFELARDSDWIYDQQTRDLGSWDIPVSSQTSYNLKEDWDYDNIGFLVQSGWDFFLDYPYQEDLPTWSFFKHGLKDEIFKEQQGYISNAFSNRDSEIVANDFLMKSVLPVTKYYVRYVYFDKAEDGSYKQRNSQWMSYKVGFNLLTISPIEGDPIDGTPIETDPITGPIDGDGNYTGGGGSNFNINTDNPLELIMSFIDTVLQMPALFGEFSLFLTSAFAFIPSHIWNIIGSGVTACVALLIFRLVK